MQLFSILYFLIVLLIVWQPKKINRGAIALLAVIILLPFGILEISDVANALLGNELLKPFEIITILVTLAVITTALDDSGFFKYASYKAILLSKNNGVKLFRNFFLLTIILTGFTSNDIDVLTVTPVVLWFAIATKINPAPYLFAVFVAANTSSMEFLIGNLTNIIIGSFFNLPFVSFFAIMIAPTLVTLVGQYWLLRLLFQKQIPTKILDSAKLKKINEKISKPIENKEKNIFLLTTLALVIIFSALSDFAPFEIWHVTTIGALTTLLSGKFNVIQRFKSIPWTVVVFALSFIILTYKLETTGTIDAAISLFSNAFNSIWSSVFFSSLLGAVGSGLMNNIPASISLSSILAPLSNTLLEGIEQAIAYGLIVGTNIGAIFSPVGALATMLWFSIIRQKGYNFSTKKFVGYGLTVGFFSIIITSAVIAWELSFIY